MIEEEFAVIGSILACIGVLLGLLSTGMNVAAAYRNRNKWLLYMVIAIASLYISILYVLLLIFPGLFEISVYFRPVLLLLLVLLISHSLIDL